MASEQTQGATWWTGARIAAVAAIVGIAAVVVWVLVAQAEQQRESDRFGDRIYCSMSGTGLGERGPETGELCADLLYDD